MAIDRYSKAVLGGTFDRLHAAHKSLLRTAAYMADEVFVGVVGPELGQELFAKKEHKDMIQSFSVRSGSVEQFLQDMADSFVVGELTDPWGPAPVDPQADVIVVSYETESNAHRINEMRIDHDLPLLDIIVIPWIYVGGDPISSTRLRREEAGSG